ncbi:30S ribosomal protein S6 [Patescibacteria group bacterium]
MKLYEITYLISPELSEEESKNIKKDINSSIQEQGGSLVAFNSNKYPIKKKIAYLIKGRLRGQTPAREAYFGTIDFNLESKNIVNLEKKVKSDPNILRYMILSKKPVRLDAKIPRALSPKPQQAKEKEKPKEKKVELKEIEKKLEEILGE